jgi:hypothetical protein
MKKQDFLPVGVSNLPIDKITYVLDLNALQIILVLDSQMKI